MNDRLFTLLGAAVALLLVLWLFGDGGAPEPEPASRPTSRDAGAAGLLGLHEWLAGAGVPVRRLRGRYAELAGTAPTASGNLLVVAEPMVWEVRPSEQDPLRAWVRDGNHVLLLRSAAQNVDWDGHYGLTYLQEALDLRVVYLRLPEHDEHASGDEDEDEDENPVPNAPAAARQEICTHPSVTRGTIAGEQRRLRPVPGRAHPVLAGVREVAVKTAYPALPSFGTMGYNGGGREWYPLLCDPQRRVPVFTVLRAGAGRVWAFDYSEAFANVNLGRADNARLFANLVAFALAPGGAVIFDDMHQGESTLYDPDAFFADPRLHGTLAFLGGIWLVWLLGYSNRFAPPARPMAGAGALEFSRAVGRFYARYLRPDEAAGGLFRHFFNQVRARYRLPPTGAPAWDVLARAPAALQPRVDELRALHARVAAGRAVDLVRLRNLLLTVQNELP